MLQSFRDYLQQLFGLRPLPGQTLPLSLAQTGIPFILAGGTGGGGLNQITVGNNGAISTLAALPTTYSGGAWLYMPAGGIFAGSLAGWYWYVASSTTAGTLFNNTYTAGQPVAPANPIPFVTTGPGLVTQTIATDIQAISIPMSGGLMGPNGFLDLRLSQSNIGAGGKTYRYRVGAANVTGVGGITNSNPSASLGGRFSNCGSQSVNKTYNGGGSLLYTGYGGGYTYMSVNTALDQSISTTLNIAAATDAAIIEDHSITLQYGA